MSSIIHSISGNPFPVPSGELFTVVVTYDYDSDNRGRLALEADIPAGTDERIQIALPVRKCVRGNGNAESYDLRIYIPAEWQPSIYAVNLVAKLTEGNKKPFRFRRIAGYFIEKK